MRERHSQFTFVVKSLVLVNIIGIAMAVNIGRMSAAESAPIAPAKYHVSTTAPTADSAETSLVEKVIMKAAEQGIIASSDMNMQQVLESGEIVELAEKAYAAAREADTNGTVSTIQ